MILSLLATNVLLVSSFIVFVFLRVTLIKIECKIPLLSLLIVINLCSFAALMLGYSWLIYALTVVIFTGFLLIHKRGSQFLKRYFCLFYIAYGFVYQLHGANDFKCFFNRFIKINYYGLPQMFFCCL